MHALNDGRREAVPITVPWAALVASKINSLPQAKPGLCALLDDGLEETPEHRQPQPRPNPTR
jgi:hypothetical protein